MDYLREAAVTAAMNNPGKPGAFWNTSSAKYGNIWNTNRNTIKQSFQQSMCRDVVPTTGQVPMAEHHQTSSKHWLIKWNAYYSTGRYDSFNCWCLALIPSSTYPAIGITPLCKTKPGCQMYNKGYVFVVLQFILWCDVYISSHDSGQAPIFKAKLYHHYPGSSIDIVLNAV